MNKTIRSFSFLAVLLLVLAACADQEPETRGADTGAEGTTTTAAAGGGETTTTAEAGGGTETVEMIDISFEPAELTVPVGTTVVWENAEGVPHTTTSDDDLWDSGTLQEGDTFEHTFEEAGTFTYICEIHPEQMQATITVEG